MKKKLVISVIILLAILILLLCKDIPLPLDSREVIQEYYQNGQINYKAEIQGNLKEGEFIKYDSLGNLKYKANFKNDTLNGRYLSYYPEGGIRVKASYSNGNLENSYMEFYENGNLKNIRFYVNDTAKYLKRFDFRGKLTWFAFTAKVDQEIKDSLVNIKIEIPYSSIQDVSVGFFLFVGNENTLDTLKGDYTNGLFHSFSFPKALYNQVDTLILEVYEASGITGSIIGKTRDFLTKNLVHKEFRSTGNISQEE